VTGDGGLVFPPKLLLYTLSKKKKKKAQHFKCYLAMPIVVKADPHWCRCIEFRGKCIAVKVGTYNLWSRDVRAVETNSRAGGGSP